MIKPTIRILSDKIYKLEVSHEVLGKSMDVAVHIDEVRDVIRQATNFPGDWCTPKDCHITVPNGLSDTISDVLFDNYLPVPTKRLQGEVSKAMSMAIKVALNAEMATLPPVPRVLIVGSGYGNDVRRVLRSAELAGRGSIQVTCVEPDQDRYEKSYSEIHNKYPGVKFINKTINDAYPELSSFKKFDMILCTMSLQFVVGCKNEKIKDFSSLLTEKGVLLGTHFDHDSYYSNLPLIVFERGSSIIVGRRKEAPFANFGVNPVSIYGTTFVDPYINGLFVHLYCVNHDLDYNYFRGVHALEHYGMKSLARTVKSASVTSCLVSLLVAHKRGPPLLFSPCVNTWECPVIRHASMIRMKDLPYYRLGTFAVGIKRDGYRKIAILDSRGLVYDGKIIRCPSFGVPLLLQIEETKTERYLVDAYERKWFDDPPPFLQRYELMKVLYRSICAWFPFVLNEFYVPYRPVDLAMLQLKANKQEGLIIMPLTAYRPVGFSDARYVKHVVTVDLNHGNEIAEFALHNNKVSEFLRKRPDKEFRNSDATLRDALTAPTVSEFFSVVIAQNTASDESPSDGYLTADHLARQQWNPEHIMELWNDCPSFDTEEMTLVNRILLNYFSRPDVLEESVAALGGNDLVIELDNDDYLDFTEFETENN